MAGETVAPPVLEDIRRVLQTYADRLPVSEVKTLHLGPRTILVALTIEIRSKGLTKAERDLSELTASVRSLDERIAFVYFRFD
jgi:hypothetical protein